MEKDSFRRLNPIFGSGELQIRKKFKDNKLPIQIPIIYELQ